LLMAGLRIQGNPNRIAAFRDIGTFAAHQTSLPTAGPVSHSPGINERYFDGAVSAETDLHGERFRDAKGQAVAPFLNTGLHRDLQSIYDEDTRASNRSQPGFG
jgi:hypothetical protein